MKKIFALMLALMMLASLAACGNTAEPTDAPTDAVTEPEAEVTEATEGEAAEPEATEGNAAEGGETLDAMIQQIYAQHPVELALGSIPVDLTDTSEDGLWNLKRFTGLDSADGISEVAVSEAMIGSMAYSLVLVRVADPANAQTVAQSMKDGIDPAKWVCVMADDLAVCGAGDVVMLAMLGSELGAEIGTSAQDLVNAFQTVAGGELDFVIE